MEKRIAPRKVVGLTWGTVTAWFGVFLFYMCSTMSIESTQDAVNAIEFFFLFLITWYLAFGLPIAFIICFTFGGLAWYIFEAFHLTKMRHALLGGGIVGAILGVLTIFMSYGINDFKTVITHVASPILIGILSGFVTHYFGYKIKSPNS